MMRGMPGMSIGKAQRYLESKGFDLIYSFIVDSYTDFAPIINWKNTYSAVYFLTDEGTMFSIDNDTPSAITFSAPGAHRMWLYGVPKSDVRIVDSQSPVLASSPWTLHSADPVMPYFSFAFIWFDGTTYHAYGGYDNYTKIGHATSPDGLTWTNDTENNPVMAVTPGGTYDQTSVAVPNVWIEGETWYMLYRGNGNSVCLATSPDGLTWTKYANNPVISNQADPAGIIKVGSVYWLFCNTTGGNRYVSVYSSTDLHEWTRQTPDPLMRGGRYCSCPFKYNNKYYLIVSKYWGPANEGGSLELFCSDTPGFLNGELLGVVVNHPANPAVDTPTIVTDTIFRDTFPDDTLLCYYSKYHAPTNPIVYPLFLAVQEDIAAAIAAAVPISTEIVSILGDGDFVGITSPSLSANRFYMQRFAATETATITNIKAVCAKAGRLKVAIYSDNSNVPDSLLASSISTSVVSGNNRIPLVSSLEVTEGTFYWIVFNQNLQGIVRYTNSGGVANWVASTYANSFPATMPATTAFFSQLSVSAWVATTDNDFTII